MIGTNGDSLGIRQLQQRIKELEEKNKALKEQLDMLVKDDEEQQKTIIRLRTIIDKTIEYIRSEYTITDDDVYLALYGSDGTLGKLENILEGKENE